MRASREGATSAAPVERFKPTNGMLPGSAGLLLAAVGIGYIAFEARTATGLRVALGLALFGVVVWMTQLRPRAAAYAGVLLLKNSLIDTSIPLRLVDEVSASRTLNVWVGDRRHVCIGIGRSMRTLLKGAADQRPDQSAVAYETFVVYRIRELAQEARKSSPSTTPQEVRRVLAWPEAIALAVIGVAFVASLLL